MRCPLCSPIQTVEGPLLTHLLQEHPEAQAAAALALPLGTLVLRRWPTRLLAFYLGLMMLALLIATPSAWRRG